MLSNCPLAAFVGTHVRLTAETVEHAENMFLGDLCVLCG